jgi:hypothetical protein
MYRRTTAESSPRNARSRTVVVELPNRSNGATCVSRIPRSDSSRAGEVFGIASILVARALL